MRFVGDGDQVLVRDQTENQVAHIEPDQHEAGGERKAGVPGQRAGGRNAAEPLGQVEHGRHQEGDDHDDKQAGQCPRHVLVERLLLIAQPAQEHRQPQHQQHVGDHGAGDAGLDHLDLAGPQRKKGDCQFGRIAEGGVEQAAERGAGMDGEVLGRLADQRGHRHDGKGS